jgi:hypothetical protein
MQFVLRLLEDTLHLLLAPRPLLECPPESSLYLPAIIFLATAVALHDGDAGRLRLLVGAETSRATLAFAATTDRAAFLGLARIDDLRIIMTAERTTHSFFPTYHTTRIHDVKKKEKEGQALSSPPDDG